MNKCVSLCSGNLKFSAQGSNRRDNILFTMLPEAAPHCGIYESQLLISLTRLIGPVIQPARLQILCHSQESNPEIPGPLSCKT